MTDDQQRALKKAHEDNWGWAIEPVSERPWGVVCQATRLGYAPVLFAIRPDGGIADDIILG